MLSNIRQNTTFLATEIGTIYNIICRNCCEVGDACMYHPSMLICHLVAFYPGSYGGTGVQG